MRKLKVAETFVVTCEANFLQAMMIRYMMMHSFWKKNFWQKRRRRRAALRVDDIANVEWFCRPSKLLYACTMPAAAQKEKKKMMMFMTFSTFLILKKPF